MSIISVAGHQVVKNLSRQSEITLVQLDFYTDYLSEKDLKLDTRAMIALLTTGGPRLMRVNGHYERTLWSIPSSDESSRDKCT